MPGRQEIIRDFELWWEAAGRALAEQVMAHEADRPFRSPETGLPRDLLLITYTQGRIDESARVIRQLEERRL